MTESAESEISLGGRFQRHSLIDWFSQEEVASAHIAVLGAGAVGNEVIKNLALLGVGNIDVFDFDQIEIHNLTRSVLFRESDIGQGKADTAAIRAKELDQKLNITAIQGDIWHTLKLREVKKYSAVICCVDNFEARLKINQLCYLAGVDFVNTGIDSRFASVEVFPFSADGPCACYECGLPATVYQRIGERYSCGWLKRASMYEKKIPTTIITSSIAAAHATSAALRLGSQSKEVDVLASRTSIDTISGRSTVVRQARNEECAWCSQFSSRPTVLRMKPSSKSILQNIKRRLPQSLSITLSDPIVFGGKCEKCGDTECTRRACWHRSAEFTDDLTTCEMCNEKSVHVEIRDRFLLNELEEGLGDNPLRAKFGIVQYGTETLCLDLED